MLNQLLRFTLVSSALLWLRPRWRGLLALSVFVILVHVLHGEYLGYVALSEDQSFLVASYVVKWLALLGSVAAYFVFAVSDLKPGIPRIRDKVRTKAVVVGTEQPEATETDDGFDFLRNKKQLQSPVDKIIDTDSGGRPPKS